MIRLDHLAIKVRDVPANRDWYSFVLGLAVEFDTAGAAGLKDDGGFTLILVRSKGLPSDCNLYFQVADVSLAHRELVTRGVEFLHPPQDNDWGYGAGLLDPDGRLVGLWDEDSMAAHRGGPHKP